MQIIDLTEIRKMVSLQSKEKTGFLPIEFSDRELREVILELNTEEATRLALEDTTGTRFLTDVQGRARLRFKIEGRAAVWVTSEGGVQYWTAEMENHNPQLTTDEQFTIISERKRQNPELERIAKLMSYNSQKREGMLMREMRATQDQLKNLLEKQEKPDDKKPDDKKPEEKPDDKKPEEKPEDKAKK